MAQKQTKKTTAAKGRKKAAPKKAQQKPIRREVGAGVCLLLAVFTVLACFQIHAAFLDALATLCRGLIGAGFYILPFAFLMGFLILLLHDGRPVALRVTCTFLVAVLIGSLVQLVGGGGVEWSQNVLENLWDGGIAGTSGRRGRRRAGAGAGAGGEQGRRGDPLHRGLPSGADHEPEHDREGHHSRNQKPAEARV